MILTVSPTPVLKGKIVLPASKSYSIRAFIVAACGGSSRIVEPSDCDDARVAMRVARYLGAKVKARGRNTWEVQADACPVDFSRVNVGESGTALRFLLPLMPLYAPQGRVVGEGTLVGRPNHLLTRVLRERGVDIRGQGERESVPIEWHGGVFAPGKMTIDGSLSSQFISALLITAPMLEGDSELRISGKKIVSTDYIVMTREILGKCGIVVHPISERRYKIPGGQDFRGLRNFRVPSDYGLAAFMLAAAVLTSSRVTLTGHLADDLPQADGRILEFLRKMGARFHKSARSMTIQGPCALLGGDFSLKDCPDLVPIMAVLALFARGRTRLRHIAHARVKESDRISDLRVELLKAGARVIEKDNELIIEPFPETAALPQARKQEPVLLDPHRDHRLAMAFCVLGLKLGVRVKDIDCVSKSYPGFVNDFRTLGAKVTRSR